MHLAVPCDTIDTMHAHQQMSDVYYDSTLLSTRHHLRAPYCMASMAARSSEHTANWLALQHTPVALGCVRSPASHSSSSKPLRIMALMHGPRQQ